MCLGWDECLCLVFSVEMMGGGGGAAALGVQYFHH